MTKTSLVIADDHALVREGTIQLLDEAKFNVLAQAADGLSALEACMTHQPDIALLDISMPKMSGIEVARKYLKESPDAKVILLSASADEENVRNAMQLPIKGYLLKADGAEHLNHALSMVKSGGTIFPAEVMRVNAEAPLNVAAAHLLTPREEEILQHLAQGEANKVIALKLGVSEGTVKVHIKAILKKLNLSNRTQAAIFAYRSGLNANSQEKQ